MKKVPLSRGLFTLVDDADYELVSKHKWCAHWAPATKSYYATRNDRTTGKHRTVRLARFLLGLGPGDKRQADHKNGDTLDDRRSINLRIATPSQNCLNQRKRINNTSGLKGAYWHSTKHYWFSAISVDGKLKHLGVCANREEAHKRYVKAAKIYHGEFANKG